MTYTRKCPQCDSEIVYKSYGGFYNANRNGSKCKPCYQAEAGKKRSKTWKERAPTKHIRQCPSCGDDIQYASRKSLTNANLNQSECRACYQKKVSETLKKRHKEGTWGPTPPHPNLQERKKFHKTCPVCGGTQSYTRKDSRDAAERDNTMCNSCSNRIHKKSWNHVITDEHVLKMRAAKAGFDSWEEYVEKYPDKQFYKREVWRYTYQNDLESLEHWEKRGRCGVEGAYQLDHIISINEGWHKGIAPEEIGRMDNLRMIPWKQNRNKAGQFTTHSQ